MKSGRESNWMCVLLLKEEHLYELYKENGNRSYICMNSIKKIEIIRYSPVCAYNPGDLSNCPIAYRAFSIYYK